MNPGCAGILGQFVIAGTRCALIYAYLWIIVLHLYFASISIIIHLLALEILVGTAHSLHCAGASQAACKLRVYRSPYMRPSSS